MSEIRSHRDLLVWQRAMDVAVSTYELTRLYPRDELFGLTCGSLKELETHLDLAQRVGLASPEPTRNLLDQTDELGRMLHSLISKVQDRTALI